MIYDRSVFSIPDSMKMGHTGPLICAGITAYTPLNRFVKDKKDQQHVGIIGFGGLGRMAVKNAKVMEQKWQFSLIVWRRNSKQRGWGVSACVCHGDAGLMESMERSIDAIPDPISIGHEVVHMISTRKVGGTYCFLGGVPEPVKISAL